MLATPLTRMRVLSRLLPTSQRLFSQDASALHKRQHTGDLMNSKFYENDFVATSIKEIEFVRSPFYDLAKANEMTSEGAHELLESFTLKNYMIDETSEMLMSPFPARENVNMHIRYQDAVDAPEDQKHIF
jgi:hypothetical protein